MSFYLPYSKKQAFLKKQRGQTVVNKIKGFLFCTHPGLKQVGELVFRLILSLFIITHGWAKLLAFSEKAETFPEPLGFLGSCLSLMLIIFAEFFCGLCLMTGFLTRFASLVLLTALLTAGLIFHFGDPFSQKELALLYAAGFFYFLMAGGGRYSIDTVLRKRFFTSSS